MKARRISRASNRWSSLLGIPVVAADVEDLEALQVEIAVQCLNKHLPRSLENVEGPGSQSDRGIELEVDDRE